MDLTILDYVKIEVQPHYITPVHLDNQVELDDMFVRFPLPLTMNPGARWLLGTKDVVHIASGTMGLIQLRSTFARAGLISPPTYADPGFRGNLTLELKNANQYHSIEILPGMKLFSMVLVPCIGEETYDEGHWYQGQTGITGPRAIATDQGVGVG